MKKRFFLAILLTSLSGAAMADPALNALTNNNANQFAAQAGAIGGSAQACGQNISNLNQRVVEVINVLTKNPTEQQMAMTVYEKIVTSSELNQKNNHAIKCNDVLQAYHSLPLLKSDYKTAVLPEMAKLAGTPNA